MYKFTALKAGTMLACKNISFLALNISLPNLENGPQTWSNKVGETTGEGVELSFVDQAGLELRDLLVSTSLMGIKGVSHHQLASSSLVLYSNL